MKKKNKTLNYVLIVLVLGIWGTIIYRVFTYGEEDNDISYAYSNISLPELTTSTALKASYTLKGDYDDPFLNTKKSKRSKSSTKAKKGKGNSNKKNKLSGSTVNGTTAKMEEKPPSIIYKGFSLNNNEVSRVKLEIAGKTYTLQRGESVQDVRVIEMNRNRVSLQWKKKSLVVERN